MYQNLKAAGSWIKSQLSRQPGTHSYTQSEQWLESESERAHFAPKEREQFKRVGIANNEQNSTGKQQAGAFYAKTSAPTLTPVLIR
jgi:hypothetical protein